MNLCHVSSLKDCVMYSAKRSSQNNEEGAQENHSVRGEERRGVSPERVSLGQMSQLPLSVDSMKRHNSKDVLKISKSGSPRLA